MRSRPTRSHRDEPSSYANPNHSPRPAIMPTPHSLRNLHANPFRAPCQNRRVAPSRCRLRLVQHQGERHLRHRTSHHAGRLPFENRRAQSGTSQKEILTARRLNDMALTQGSFQEYDFNRMVVLFTMKNDQVNVACAISTDAMDQLEGSSRTPAAQREQQFLRLRDRIEARAARKFSDVELEGNPPGVILRAIDFRAPLK